MSAPILQPGDHIHLALPISPVLYGDALVAAGQHSADLATQQHAEFGVVVSIVSHCSTLTHPVVVAVLRRGDVGSGVTA